MLTTRQCSEADREFVHAVMKRNMAHYFDKYLPEKWSDEKFHNGFNPSQITILETDGLPIGFYDVEEVNEYLYVHNLQVIKKHRGQGITLNRLIDEEAKSRGLTIIRGKVFRDNERAICFFKLKGYSVIENIELSKSENSVYVEKKLQ